MLPLLDYKELGEDEQIFGESYDSEDDKSESSMEPINEIDVKEYGTEENGGESQDRSEDAFGRRKQDVSGNSASMSDLDLFKSSSGKQTK